MQKEHLQKILDKMDRVAEAEGAARHKEMEQCQEEAAAMDSYNRGLLSVLSQLVSIL